MKIKVSLFSKTLWRRYLVLVSGLSVFGSLFFVAVEIPDGDKMLVTSLIATALVLVYFLLWLNANTTSSRKLNINGSPLEIKVGDIFEQGELRAIGFNEYFDTIVDDAIISKSSLNGIYISDHVKDVKALDNAINSDDHLSTMVEDRTSRREKGRKNRYRLGSIHLSGKYLLVAFSRFDTDNRAYLTMRDYINCLMTFWEEVDRLYAGRSVAIPLMGSGITRIRDVNISEQELLDQLIWTFRVSRVKFRHPARVTVVIHESIKDKINFYELRA